MARFFGPPATVCLILARAPFPQPAGSPCTAGGPCPGVVGIRPRVTESP